jgi:hypothetical protein
MRILNEEEKVGLHYCNHFDVKKTERGFKYLDFWDLYDKKCSIQESSLAKKEAIWLGRERERMHIDKETAKKIIKVLEHFVTHGLMPEKV